jgi:hypothetical protein
MNPRDLIPILLLALILALTVAILAVVFAVRQARRRGDLQLTRVPEDDAGGGPAFRTLRSVLVQRPPCWLAIRGRSVEAVQAALVLHNPRPCTWLEGRANEQKLFIAPAVRGWILVIGSGLPEPGDDVDVCFRFLTGLSRKLGQVQFFGANRVVGHHAWVRAEAGRIVRAYAWAERTLWNQGVKTAEEFELGLKCFHYVETSRPTGFGQSELMAANTEKVPLLAARWSLDPAEIDERHLEHAHGVAGDGTAPWY